ncbi:MAG: hypothetical protein WBD10_05335 [Acidobacteriaceae bacterium]
MIGAHADGGAPGGETAYIDAQSRDFIVFHALNLKQAGLHDLCVNPMGWSSTLVLPLDKGKR